MPQDAARPPHIEAQHRPVSCLNHWLAWSAARLMRCAGGRSASASGIIASRLRAPTAASCTSFAPRRGYGLPAHGHNGAELTLVLRGAYQDEVGRFGIGDAADLDESVEHRPVADATPAASARWPASARPASRVCCRACCSRCSVFDTRDWSNATRAANECSR